MLTPQGLKSKLIVSISAEGIITDISESNNLDGVASLEFYSGVLLPSLVAPFIVDPHSALYRKLKGEGVDFWLDNQCDNPLKSVVDIINSFPETSLLQKLLRLTYDNYAGYKGIVVGQKAHLVLVTNCNIAHDRLMDNISFRRII